MDKPSFNLIDQPWIPCVEAETGRLIEVGLRDILCESHRIRGVTCETPLHDAAITVLLLVILHRVFGPEDEEAWEALYARGQFPSEAIEQYLSQWYSRFDLFDAERPFYQADDPRVKPKTVIHLLHSMGNTGALFSHADENTGLSMTPAEAARTLVAAINFRTAGLSGLPDKFTDGTLTRGVLYFSEGDTLYETLLLNLVAYPEMQYFPTEAKDAPTWEQDEPHAPRNVPHGYLDYLTWQSTRTRLIPEERDGTICVREMTIAPGLRLHEDVQSPLKMFLLRGKANDQRWFRTDFSEDRALWRDYESLFDFRSDKTRPPVTLKWAASLRREGYVSGDQTCVLRCIGFLADQAKPIFYREQLMPIPAQYLTDEGDVVERIREGRFVAEAVDSALNKALYALAAEVLQRGSDLAADKADITKLKDHWGVSRMYWSRLEPAFWDFVLALPYEGEAAVERWHETLRGLARELLQATCSANGPTHSSARAEVKANAILHSELHKIFNSVAETEKGQ